MAKLRSVSTAFWSDPFIEDLTPNQKLLFLYLITNEKTNMLGIYEASIKKISFETGLNKLEIEKALKAFESLGKVKYVNNYIILMNYMKHQNFNTNMKKSAIDVYNDLPKELKQSDIIISKDNPLEGFEMLLKAFGMVRKIEDEYEYEYEVEDEDKCEKIVYNKFYDSELFENGEIRTDIHPAYHSFVKFIFGEDQLHQKMKGVLSMDEQLSNKRFVALMEKAKTHEKTLSDMLQSIENGKYYKKNTSLYKTLNTWISR